MRRPPDSLGRRGLTDDAEANLAGLVAAVHRVAAGGAEEEGLEAQLPPRATYSSLAVLVTNGSVTSLSG